MKKSTDKKTSAESAVSKNLKAAEGGAAHPAHSDGAADQPAGIGARGRYGQQEDLDAEDFFSENHYADDPERRNLL